MIEFFYLMDGSADAFNFHKHAVMYLDEGRQAIFEGGLHDIYALSQISAYIYSLFGEDIMFMQLISLRVSSLSLIIFYYCLGALIRNLCNHKGKLFSDENLPIDTIFRC